MTPATSLSSAARAWSGGAVAAVALAMGACAHATPGQTGHTSPIGEDRLRPPVSSPGTEVPGTRVSVPRTVQAGAALEGIAPSGSMVEVDGTQLQVGRSGRFAVTAPSPRDEWQIRIVRPAPATPLVFRVQVLPPGVD